MIFGTHDDNTIAQFNTVRENAFAASLMADGHYGYVMPIGGVAAYENKVSIIGVGVDIGCGNCAIKTDLTMSDIGNRSGPWDSSYDPVRGILGDIADEIVASIAFGPGKSNPCSDAPKDHPLFEDERWAVVPRKQQGNLIDKARAQLGTTGGGNHYVDVFTDSEHAIWVGVHFGSRGMGYQLATSFLSLAQGGEWLDRPDWNQEVLLDLDTQLGQDYWDAMELAGEYAYAGREWVARKVVEILGAKEVDMVHNHHNFAWEEEHQGVDLIVVRKGATPAGPGVRGFVGGSMGDQSVILEGTSLDGGTLQSTVHGAGRVMGRMAAKGKWKRGKQIRPGLISQEDMDVWMAGGAILRGGDLDEAPQAYRRLDDVLVAQGDTIKVTDRLDPIIVCMAPKDGRRGR